MPLLGAMFVSLFTQLFAFLAATFSRKVAVAAAAVTALGTATVAMLAAFNSLVSPFLASLFSTQYGQFIGLAFPPIAGTCLAAIGTAWAAIRLYRWQVTAIKISASA